MGTLSGKTEIYSITRPALRWTPDSGRRKRGRSRKTWRRRTIEAEMKTAGKTMKELEKAAMDREQWKSLSQHYVPPRRDEDYVMLPK